MDEDDLRRRTKRFALRVIKLVAALPKTASGRAIGNQLVCAGTSVGSNLSRVLSSASKAEFIARLGVVEEEADESEYWMELIIDGGLMKEKLVEPLRIEAHELCAIMTSSRISAAKNKMLARKAIELRKRAIKNQKSRIKNQ